MNATTTEQNRMEAIDAATLWAAYCAANPETRMAANFVLLDEKAEQPEWATLDCRAWRDAMRYAVVRWLRNPPKPKLKLVK